MIKKPWSPDDCPLQVGAVIYDPSLNVDRMVTRRYLSYEDNCTNEDKDLVTLDTGVTYTGRELMNLGFTYYSKWPSTLEEEPCYHEIKEPDPLYCVLTQGIFNAVRDSHYAVEGKHYTTDEKGTRIWEDDLATAVNNAADNLAKVFEEFNDEQ